MQKTADEIKKGLECCIEMCSSGNCPYFEDPECTTSVKKDALAIIQQLEAQVPRWIPVEERLPEDCKHVLVFLRRNFVVGWSVDYWHIDTDWLDDGKWSKNPPGGYFRVTHWMPLPEPPKEEPPC